MQHQAVSGMPHKQPNLLHAILDAKNLCKEDNRKKLNIYQRLFSLLGEIQKFKERKVYTRVLFFFSKHKIKVCSE